jgi:FAD:protein FMN transferase
VNVLPHSVLFRAALPWTCVLLGTLTGFAAELQKFVFEKAEMGLPFRVTLYSERAEAAKTAADAAFRRIAELNQIFSDYEDDSELARLSRSSGSGQKVKVSDPLWAVLQRAQELAEQSGGAFDVTCGPLTSVWRRARRKFELPSPELVAEMKARSGWRSLRLDPATHTAELLMPQMRLDLGSLAKGYAVDAALAVLKESGHNRALVAGGGDMAAGEPPPGRTGWRIEVAALDADQANAKPVVVELRSAGIATSGDRFQRLEIGGKRYSHILDMRSGEPLTDHALVTVIAKDCFTASISTTLCVLGPEAGMKLAEVWNAAARWQRQPADKVEIATTATWAQWLAPAAAKE